MSTTSSKLSRGKIWLPKDRTISYVIEIDGTDVTNDVISAEFTRGIFGVESPCKVTLIDSDGTYADTYSGGEVIEFKCDYVSGIISRWKGTLERPVKQFRDAYTLELVGSHYQSELLDITVTKEYTGSDTTDTILKELIDDNLTGYTYTNVTSSTATPTIKWNNKPFYDCVLDLCEVDGYDCYVDTDKDFHYFEQESIENTEEAIVWNDTLLQTFNFGADNLDVRNRITVYGEDETGLPVVYQANDSSSQTTYGIKEKVIKDTSIVSYNQAKDFGDAILTNEKEKANKGKFLCLLTPGINPGDMIWIAHPIQKIRDTFRIVKYTHKIPNEQTEITISKEKSIPTLFKERKKAELATENLVNPYSMTHSFNFNFDDEDEYDSTLSSNIELSEGNLKTDGATSGIMVSANRLENFNITAVHIKVVGEVIVGTTYEISTDNGSTWEKVNIDKKKILTDSGTHLRLKITLNSASTLIDSVVVMYK